MLQQQFKQAIEYWQEKNTRFLIATSGGLDSTVLCHLCHSSGINFGIAHCNFRLRGQHSDGDEVFVKELAKSLGVPHFTIQFNTTALASERKQSIQIAARELRYEWLERIRQKEGFDYIITAHHINDSIETALYNFAKGCGIRGLHGIPDQNGFIIRPLLNISREDIMSFAIQENIAYREDSSNASDKYARNKIRHHIVPVLKQLNTSLEQTAVQTFGNIQAAETLYDFALATIKNAVWQTNGQEVIIDLQKLGQYPVPDLTLYEYLKPYGIHSKQIKKILSADNGALFYSSDNQYECLVHQEQLLIRYCERTKSAPIQIETIPSIIETPTGKLSIEYSAIPKPPYKFESQTAYLDASKLALPLKLRPWQAGDIFKPLGMKGRRQKLQDFFSNLKLSRFEKEKVRILETNQQIAWIVNYRIDERFKITNTTKQAVKLSWQIIPSD